jgi:UPF0755 protein
MSMSRKIKLWILIIGILIFISGSVTAYFYYQIYVKTLLPVNDSAIPFYIRTGTDYPLFTDNLAKLNLALDTALFDRIAKLKNLPAHIHPGKYLIKPGMSMHDLIVMFRSGNQEIIELTFNTVHFKSELAGVLASQIEQDSLSLYMAMNDQEIAQSYGFDSINFISMFIPNTYFVYWNTDTRSLFDRMFKEYTQFWNSNRLELLDQTGLSKTEVTILASIVEKETAKNDEKERIAGVYMNRLKAGIGLYADPTIKFALRDFSKTRITKKDTEISSPYNTYKVAGLPPGPICTPGISSIDAVLNYESHDYYYFCARDDFSGYHAFAKNLTQHTLNARKYHKALNKKKIFQ